MERNWITYGTAHIDLNQVTGLEHYDLTGYTRVLLPGANGVELSDPDGARYAELKEKLGIVVEAVPPVMPGDVVNGSVVADEVKPVKKTTRKPRTKKTEK